MAEKTKRVLSDDEAANLVSLSAKVAARQGEVRSCGQNLGAFQDFLAEADLNLARTDLSDGEKKAWQSRRDHCAGKQTADEQAKQKVAQALLDTHRKALEAEKAKFGPSLAQDGDKWTVDA